MGHLLAAFGAGVMSFFSPCVLPLLPGYLSMLSGFSASELINGHPKILTRKVVRSAAFFALGFTVVFTAMGAAASAVGDLLASHKAVLAKIFGVVTALLGVHMTGLFNFNFLNYEKRFSMRGLAGGPAGAFVMGFAFALGWSPCIGPMLAFILGLAAVSSTVVRGVALLLVYSAGLALPFLVAAFLTARFFAVIGRFKHALHYVEIAAGVILIIFGALLFLDKMMIAG